MINFIILIIFLLLLYFCLRRKTLQKYTLTISIISCNRIYYFNLSLSRIIKHIKDYERYLIFTLIVYDQGTPNRENIINEYKIKNFFYLNPNGYAYSFKLLFSYINTKYILILEEDWLIIKNIEKLIVNSNFLYTSMKVLSNTNSLYGLYLRHHPKGESTKKRDKILNITYYEVYKPWKGFCYTNGASIYKTKYLKKMNYGRSEYQTARKCMKLNYHIGFINWKLLNSNNGIYFPFKHIGVRRTNTGLCNISFY